jgi:hypothetical protein
MGLIIHDNICVLFDLWHIQFNKYAQLNIPITTDRNPFSLYNYIDFIFVDINIF